MSRKKTGARAKSALRLFVNDSHTRRGPLVLEPPPFALKKAPLALAVRARPEPLSLAALLARHQARQRQKELPRAPVTAHPSLSSWQAVPSGEYSLSYGSQAEPRPQQAQEGDSR